ncbi:AI-2E family transporter [Cereibacter azotoformans]|uniref:AI-2E family transporter n=2 Tax=Cereibacter TaxID=1653176 RepID=A4WX14_CERS5|nr:AI-2E family transporter [Cereibacter azotoformans]AXQ94587.1 AI-2E family transporter [Cereibacter sphaeroides]MBO4170573.1 AI-2E family transporter [Cereibacter azotoformans]PTR09199.1 putative PurR-regulated permease PerM [Cereibacter azotoformans]UIJ30141.1 AI-2E family transporter [Cereibacter azotoformans]ULB10797.1 AI-2E family transporter [Cereibacter azotoformans]
MNETKSEALSDRQDRLKRARKPLITDISAARWLLLLILAASVYFFHGFLVPVLAAVIIAFASWPLLQRLERSLPIGRAGAGALLLMMIVGFLVIPVMMALLYAFRELQSWIGWAINTNSLGAPPPVWLETLPHVGPWIGEKWRAYIGEPGAISEMVQLVSGANIGTISRGILTAGTLAFHLALTLLFMLIALFIFYRDGERIAAQVDRVGSRILPDRWDRISRVVPATISSTVTGMTLIAMGEGVVLGTAYWIAGMPSPVTLGVITGFMALVPGGAPFCVVAASSYLAASGSPWAGLGLFLWGTIELFIVDKTIRPVLVGGPVKLPFLPTFFGLVGGIETMGIVGLFVGPVLMALLVSMWREWQREIDIAEAEEADPIPRPPPEPLPSAIRPLRSEPG